MARGLQTAETEFYFDLTGVSGVHYLDIGQILCLANRKGAYRQGLQYVFKLELYGVEEASTVMSVSTLPENWCAVNAWEKGFRHWRAQQQNALTDGGLRSTAAKYNDFKIYYDAIHAAAGVGGNLLPFGYAITSGASATESYEWWPSAVVLPNSPTAGVTTEYYLHMIGDDAAIAGDDTKGLIKAYAESRARPFQTDPNIVDVPTGGLYGKMIDVGDELNEVITNVQEENEKPPYLIDVDTAVEFYPGGANQSPAMTSYIRDVLSVRNGPGAANSDSTSWITANCGLLALLIGANADAMKLSIAPGPFHGVMARPMQDVN